MKRKVLGRTELEVSTLSLGTWQFGGAWGKEFSQKEVSQMVAVARDAGVNMIDTAECYGNHVAEALIGEAIKGQRDQWVLATKFGHDYETGVRAGAWAVKNVEKQLNDSLKALQTEYLDLYQFHSGPVDAFENDELWTFLDKQKQAGKIRFLGNSLNHHVNIYQAKRGDQYGIDVLQIPHNMLLPETKYELLPYAYEKGLGVLIREVLANGLLTGKYDVGQRWHSGDHRSNKKSEIIDDRIQQAHELLKLKPEVASAAQWATGWVLSDPMVHSVLMGCKSVDQLRDNLESIQLIDDVSYKSVPMPSYMRWRVKSVAKKLLGKERG